MFFLAVLAIAVGVAGVAVTAGRPQANRRTPSGRTPSSLGRAGRVGASRIPWASILVIGIALLLLGSFTVVPARSVGIQTSFGQTVGTLDPGLHAVRPWSSVDTWDASIQTVKYDGGRDDEKPLTVRLKNQTTATVNVTVQWRLASDADITQLYKDYRKFEAIADNVVKRQLQNALNEVFEDYDPLASITGDGTQLVQLSDLAKKALPALQAAMPKGVEVLNLTLPNIQYDAVVQDNINKIIAAAAATKQAEQQEMTAKALAEAAKQLSAGDLSPAVLYQNCLSMVERLLSAGHELPAGFTCGAPPTTVVPAPAR
jgi:regulator of protease activity HflC (stomatin/prohibitin superfamily)